MADLLCRLDLLILDELGYLPFAQPGLTAREWPGAAALPEGSAPPGPSLSATAACRPPPKVEPEGGQIWGLTHFRCSLGF
jgi:hypothetical protein